MEQAVCESQPGPERGPGLVEVWTLPISPRIVEDRRLQQVLSTEEKSRATRFRKPEDRARYIVAHGALRLILYRVFGIDFASQRFERGRYGKPRLASPDGRQPVHFNLSHSGDLALVAVSPDVEIGVDIEAIDPALPPDVAGGFCSPQELEWLGLLPEQRYILGVYRLWTMKEALTKALGWGVGRPMSEISIDLSSPESPSVRHAGEPEPAWSVRELLPPASYAAAVAGLSGGMTIRQFTVPLCYGELDLP